MTDTALEKQLATELAREVVADLAPNELTTFRATSAAYFKDPDQAFKGPQRDEMLAFGGGDAVMLLTPYALAIARPVVHLLVEELGKGLTERSADVIVRWVRRIFRRHEATAADDGTDPEPEPLTSEQLNRIQQLALEKGRELDLPERDAKALTNAIIASLVIPSP